MNNARVDFVYGVEQRYGAIVGGVACAALIFEDQNDPRLEGFWREVLVCPPVIV